MYGGVYGGLLSVVHNLAPSFQIDDGFLDGIIRGYKGGLLKRVDYSNLTQCEALDDMRLHLATTDYGNFLANEPSPLATATIAERCWARLAQQFAYIRSQAVGPLAEFLEYVSRGYMIDNVVLLLTGTLRGRDTSEMLEKLHPLGWFDSLPSLSVASSAAELYNIVLADSPLGPYFSATLAEGDLDDTNIEIIRASLTKAYLEDFYALCQRLGGTTAEVMLPILNWEADRRCITITINSFGTELSKYDRAELFPNFGLLSSEAHKKLMRAEDIDGVRDAVTGIEVYQNLFAAVGSTAADRSLDDEFFAHEVYLAKKAFDVQFGYGAFFSYFKLAEQQIRNITWIAECIVQEQRQQLSRYIPIF